MLYFITWFLGFIAFININAKTKIPLMHVYFILFIISFILLFGFRYYIGRDFDSYYELANTFDFKNSNFSFYYQYMYYFVVENKLSAYFIIFPSFIITTLLIFLRIKDYTENYALAFSVFYFGPFFMFALSGIRQALAAAIFFFSIKFIYEEKKIKYIISIFIAMLFHKSAVILFPLYFVKYIKLNRNIALFLYIISLFFIINGSQYLYGSIEFIAHNYSFPYSHYLLSMHGFSEDKKMNFISFFLIILKIIPIFIMFNYLKESKKNNLFLNFFFIMILIENVFYVVPIIRRVAIYFYLTEAIIMSLIPGYIKNKYLKIIVYFLIVGYYGVIFVNHIYVSQREWYLPFKLYGI